MTVIGSAVQVKFSPASEWEGANVTAINAVTTIVTARTHEHRTNLEDCVHVSAADPDDYPRWRTLEEAS